MSVDKVLELAKNYSDHTDYIASEQANNQQNYADETPSTHCAIVYG